MAARRRGENCVDLFKRRSFSTSPKFGRPPKPCHGIPSNHHTPKKTINPHPHPCHQTQRRHQPTPHLPTIPNPPNPLSVYQQASSKGQAIQRGGDSSKLLVQWLKSTPPQALRVLEIGCLEVDNAIGRTVEGRGGSMRRIDLKSRDPRIEEQDFMTLEVPVEVSFLNDWVDG